MRDSKKIKQFYIKELKRRDSMFKRYVLVCSTMLLVSACSSTKDGSADQLGMNDGSMSADGMSAGAPTPGTQEDLVVNVGDRVMFGYDSYDLTPEGRTTLENQAAWLAQYANLSVTIEGHADERGTREYNLALGERRATAAKNYLVTLGVNPSRVSTVSYGKERPAAEGSDEASWAQNRRGVTVVQ
jgi:peptidoglycan-associated lipoprotein